METVNCISNQKLTEIENEVYNLCVANAETYGEDGGFCYDETDYESLGITLHYCPVKNGNWSLK